MGKQYDVVILGATGFTGSIAARYMATHYNPRSATPVRWALAGRNRAKLEGVVSTLPDSSSIDLLICDVSDLIALERVVLSTHVIANFAGTPFIDKALPVVELCAKNGVHYCDITGELPLHRVSYDRFDEASKESHAIILHGCGFDSVPSDIAAFLAAKAMRERHGCACSSITGFAGKASGAFSGGTIATGIALITASEDMPGLKDANSRGAYALDPKGATGGPDKSNGPILAFNKLLGKWTAPFVMAPTNAPVVRKSNALLGYTYGQGVRYSEVQAVESLVSAIGLIVGLALIGTILLVRPLRALALQFKLLPSPGEGPSQKQQDEGFFEFDAIAVGERGKEEHVTRAHVHSGTAGDPGYKATALMSMECALCLALERERCDPKGGVLTPASALGDVLVERLQKQGMKLFVD